MIVAGRVSPEDGPGAAPGLRPDDGAEVGHLDGRVRRRPAGCSTTTPSCRASTRSSRSTCTPPGCPPGPETLIHAILTLHEKIRTGEITRRRGSDGRRHPASQSATGTPAAVPADARRRCGSATPAAERGRPPTREPAPADAVAARRRPARLPADRPAAASSCPPDRDTYCRLVAALRDDGFETVRRPLRRRLPDPPGPRPSRRGRARALRSRRRAALALAAPAACGSGARCPATTRWSPTPVRPVARNRGHGARDLRHVRHPLRRATPT